MKKLNLALGLLIACVLFNSCVKKSYDNPPDLSTYDPNLPVNMTIANLVSPYLGYASAQRVLGDSIIYGIVTADDRSGNFYKQIIIQDSSAIPNTCPGAINIVIDNTYIYTDFPIGRKVYVKLKGLYLIVYKGTPEIAYAPGIAGGAPTGIPAILEDTFIVAASYPHTVAPLEVRISALNNPNPYLNMLLKIDNVEFDSSSMGQPYALPSTTAISTARNIVGCVSDTVSGSLELYNSGYADFYNTIEPSGYGSITGIFTLYSATNQFQIRDTPDVQMTQPRCQ